MTGLPVRQEEASDPRGPGGREGLVAALEGEYDAVHAYLVRFLGDAERAADACQEAFLRAWRTIDAFRGEASVRTWFGRIAVNCARSALRKERPAEPLPDGLAGGTDPAREADRSERAARVRDALAALPDEQREVVVLRHFGGYRFAEIAGMLGLPEPTVKSRMRYGLLKLESMLNEN